MSATEDNAAPPLTNGDIESIVASFLRHIAEYWGVYKDNLPLLRRTMMVYNEFCYGIRWLPENDDNGIEFNPRDPLIDGDLEKAFGERYTDEIRSVIYDAWPLRVHFSPWLGYKEPLPDTIESLMAEYPSIFPTVEKARHHMYECTGTEYGWHNGQRMLLKPCGTPDILYAGFTTAQEFPEQTLFLDTVRGNPRIQLGIELMEASYEIMRKKKEEEDVYYESLRRNAPSDDEIAALLKRPDVIEVLRKIGFSYLNS